MNSSAQTQSGVSRALGMAFWLSLLLSVCPAAQAQPIEASGVRFDAEHVVANTKLVLNGAGTRYRAVFKVYAAGLYLPKKVATTDAVLTQPGPKRLHIVMLRDIDANDLGRLFTRGMQENASKEDFSKSIPGTLRIAEIFSTKRKLVAGENFSIEWVPGVGTVSYLNGKQQGEPVKEPEFFHTLMRIWLGNVPADAQLKDALLGKAVAPRETIVN